MTMYSIINGSSGLSVPWADSIISRAIRFGGSDSDSDREYDIFYDHVL